MATVPAPTPARPRLRRDREHGLIRGVCAGIGRHLGIDPIVVRVVFVAAAAAGGLGIALYVIALVLVPAEDGRALGGRLRSGRASLEVGAGAGLLVLAVLLAFRALGIWFSDAVTWPIVLVAAGGALLWRQSQQAPGRPSPPALDAGAEQPQTTGDRRRASAVTRTVVGVALVAAAGVAFLQGTGSLSAARDVVLAVVVVAVGLSIVFAPWILRLWRSLEAERASRIRSQERAEMAAHLHDSVLQTLALVQHRAHDPGEVAALARRQERELRAWLAGRDPEADRGSLAAALEAAAGEVERAHRVKVELVVTGDAPLDERGEALVAAAREAMVNAAKFAPEGGVDVFVEAGEGGVQAFVRDRGPGFDPHAVPEDRRGVRESILGRMERHGGRALIHAAPGGGTEVELSLPA
ncbi:MAG TPA: PspC domain-containing protein [Solirubrobacteraceae bacterium]|nr:PspC domain-containing protein [Solirubrobacteraceae bacterium]